MKIVRVSAPSRDGGRIEIGWASLVTGTDGVARLRPEALWPRCYAGGEILTWEAYRDGLSLIPLPQPG